MLLHFFKLNECWTGAGRFIDIVGTNKHHSRFLVDEKSSDDALARSPSKKTKQRTGDDNFVTVD